MGRQAYGNGATVLRESLVRACTARYVLAHDGVEAARKEIDIAGGRSFGPGNYTMCWRNMKRIG